MRLFFIVILGVMIAAGRGWAQEDNFTTERCQIGCG